MARRSGPWAGCSTDASPGVVVSHSAQAGGSGGRTERTRRAAGYLLLYIIIIIKFIRGGRKVNYLKEGRRAWIPGEPNRTHPKGGGRGGNQRDALLSSSRGLWRARRWDHLISGWTQHNLCILYFISILCSVYIPISKRGI